MEFTPEYMEDRQTFDKLALGCCGLFKITPKQFVSKSRKTDPVFARFLFSYIAEHRLFKKQLNGYYNQEFIAGFIGRERSSISSGKRSAINLYQFNKKFRSQVNASPYQAYFETTNQ